MSLIFDRAVWFYCRWSAGLLLLGREQLKAIRWLCAFFATVAVRLSSTRLPQPERVRAAGCPSLSRSWAGSAAWPRTSLSWGSLIFVCIPPARGPVPCYQGLWGCLLGVGLRGYPLCRKIAAFGSTETCIPGCQVRGGFGCPIFVATRDIGYPSPLLVSALLS